MQKHLIFAISLFFVTVTSILIIISDTGPSQSEINSVVNKAKQIYTEMKARGVDFSQGPCLSNALHPDWVLDIVHSPRLPADDLLQNQCPAYKEGRAKHFVELDLDGNLIRAR